MMITTGLNLLIKLIKPVNEEVIVLRGPSEKFNKEIRESEKLLARRKLEVKDNIKRFQRTRPIPFPDKVPNIAIRTIKTKTHYKDCVLYLIESMPQS